MVEMRTVVQKLDEQSGIAWLTLNRPEKKNAMSRKLMAELIALLKELQDNEKIKCIVTTGAGNSYSSGLDLYDLRDSWKRKRRWDEGGSTYEIVRRGCGRCEPGRLPGKRRLEVHDRLARDRRRRGRRDARDGRTPVGTEKRRVLSGNTD